MSIDAIMNEKWRDVGVPDTHAVVSMLLPEERKLLYYLASEYCDDCGSIVDAGCFLGGSTTALALGVRARQRKIGLPTQTRVHAYDLFEAEEWTIGGYLPSSFTPRTELSFAFDDNIKNVAIWSRCMEAISRHNHGQLGQSRFCSSIARNTG